MGRWAIRGLKARVGRKCSISRRRDRLYSGGTHVGGVRGESYSVTGGSTGDGELQERELPRVLNLEGKL